MPDSSLKRAALWLEGKLRWRDHEVMKLLCRLQYMSVQLQNKVPTNTSQYNSLFQDLLTVQIMGTILQGTHRKLLCLGMKIQRDQRAADLQTGWAANHVSSRGALEDPGSEIHSEEISPLEDWEGLNRLTESWPKISSVIWSLGTENFLHTHQTVLMTPHKSHHTPRLSVQPYAHRTCLPQMDHELFITLGW